MNSSIALLLDKAAIADSTVRDFRAGGGDEPFDIRRVYELGEDSVNPLSPDVLYVADTNALFAQASRLQDMSIAVAGDPTWGEGLAQMGRFRLVSVPEFDSSRKLMNTLVAAQRAVDDLDARLMWASFEKDPLAAMVGIVCDELHEPVLATDADDVLIAYAVPDGLEVRDRLFTSIRENNCFLPDAPLYDSFSAPVQEIDTAMFDDVARIPSPDPQREYLNAMVMKNGEPTIDVLVSNEGCPFSSSAADTLRRLKLLLERAFRAQGVQNLPSPDAESCVRRLLDHIFVREEVIEGYLRKRGWKVDDRYYCALAQASGPAAKTALPLLARQLRSGVMRGGVAIVHNGEVACVVRANDRSYSMDDVAEKLGVIAKRFSAQIGVSCPFRDFRELRRYYDSCRTAISYGSQETPPRTVSFFDDYAARHLEKVLFGRSVNEVLLDARASDLRIHDEQHGTELLRTLLVYLECGQNKTLAAQQLFIHRNTLVYRIGVIEKVTGIELESLDADRLFHLMYTCRYLLSRQ